MQAFTVFFIKEFWTTIIAEEPIWNWHIIEICTILEEYGHRVKDRRSKKSDLIINVPPGTSKSTICTIMFPAWLWVIDPTIRIMTVSYSQELSTDHALKSRDIIQCKKFRSYFPHIQMKKDQNNKTKYKNTKTGERYAASVSGSVLGFHAHVIIVDDPIAPSNANTVDARDAANTFMSETLSQRKVNKLITPTILIMQRLHQNDPTGYLLAKEGKQIEHIKLPATIEGTVSPERFEEFYVDGLLDPVRLPEHILEESKVDLGSVPYLGQMMQEPGDMSSGIFKRHYFEIIDIEDLPTDLFDKDINFVSDTASKAKTKNDPSGIMTSIEYNNDLYIIDYVCKRLEFPELVKEIIKIKKRYGNKRSKVYIEPKSSGSSVEQYLKRHTQINAVEYEMKEGDKESKAIGVSPYCEAKRVKLVRGAWTKDFLDEVCLFPKASHDESVDCLTMSVTQFLERKQIKPSGRSLRQVGGAK